MLDVAIIGCGVIGAAAAYELSHYPLQTAIFEAENDVADCTTKATSAILHAGCAVPVVRQSGAGPQPGRAAPPAETV